MGKQLPAVCVIKTVYTLGIAIGTRTSSTEVYSQC